MDELENLASSFIDQPEPEAEDATVPKWQRLFAYTASKATKQLQEHRSSILPVVSNEHWELVRDPPSLSAPNNRVLALLTFF